MSEETENWFFIFFGIMFTEASKSFGHKLNSFDEACWVDFHKSEPQSSCNGFSQEVGMQRCVDQQHFPSLVIVLNKNVAHCPHVCCFFRCMFIYIQLGLFPSYWFIESGWEQVVLLFGFNQGKSTTALSGSGRAWEGTIALDRSSGGYCCTGWYDTIALDISSGGFCCTSWQSTIGHRFAPSFGPCCRWSDVLSFRQPPCN